MGFLSSRFILFFFLFFIIFLATHKVPVSLQVLVFIVINYVNIALLKVYFQATENNKALIEHIETASNFIEPNSIVLPVNESDYWLTAHASNYLGAENH